MQVRAADPFRHRPPRPRVARRLAGRARGHPATRLGRPVPARQLPPVFRALY